jgi:hypothetical protein
VCGAERVDEYRLPTLELTSRKTYYPSGYLIHQDYRGTGRMPVASARAAILDRTLKA